MVHWSASEGLDYGCECMPPGQAPDQGMREFLTQQGQDSLQRLEVWATGPSTSSLAPVTCSGPQTLPCEASALMRAVLGRGLRLLFLSLALGPA